MSELKLTLDYILKRLTEATSNLLIVVGMLDSYIEEQKKEAER